MLSFPKVVIRSHFKKLQIYFFDFDKLNSSVVKSVAHIKYVEKASQAELISLKRIVLTLAVIIDEHENIRP